MQVVERNKNFTPIIKFNYEGRAIRVEIETERLCIRSYKDEDFEGSVKLYGDASLTKYFDEGRPRTREEVRKLTEVSGKSFFEKGEPFGLFSIFRKSDMAFIGHIDIVPFDEEPGTLEVGCIFDRKFHNQGFCPEAVRVFISSYVEELNKQGFKYNGMHQAKVIATVHPENKASKRVIQNVGMTFEKSEERFGNPRLWFSLLSQPVVLNHTWEAREYQEHSSVQKDAALQLLGKISWKGDEDVLDVGCGDGKITAIIANHTLKGNVIGIDASQEMITFAQQCFSTKGLPNLSFLKQEAQHLCYDQKFDVIFSSFALQWVQDIDSFFKGAHASLRRDGLLAAIIPLGISEALDKAIEAIITLPAWAPYFTGSLGSIPKFLSVSRYKELLCTHNYEMIRFVPVEHSIIFDSREDFEKYVIQWFVYLNYIPNHSKQAFFKRIIDEYLEQEPIRSSGEVVFRFSSLDIMALKVTL